MLSIGAFGGQFWSSSFPLGRTTLTGAPAIELTLDMRSSCPPVVARLWFASVLRLFAAALCRRLGDDAAACASA